MRLLVDESTGPAAAIALQAAGHDVLSVWHELRGADDGLILRIAVREERVLITNDKDFGDRVFRDREQHRGVVLLRLSSDRAADRVRRALEVVTSIGEGLTDRFTVATDDTIRIRTTDEI